MPTLFTALQAHARQTKRRKGKQKQLDGPLPFQASGIAAGVAMVEAVGRGRKRTTSEPRLSLVDRFRVMAKPNPQAHVIVVGGGFAGLSPAYELKSLGYKATVLEAQKEVGGRVQSRDDIVKEQIMEAGAELIGRNHLGWWSYKGKFGFHFRQLSDPVKPPIILGGKRLDNAAATKLGGEMHRAQRLINHAARHVNADEPWLTRRAKKLDRQSLVQDLNSIPMSHVCRLAFIEQLQTDNGVDARRQSWLGNLAMIKGGGLARFWTETETHRCKGGNQRLAFRFRDALHRAGRVSRFGRFKLQRAESSFYAKTVPGQKEPMLCWPSLDNVISDSHDSSFASTMATAVWGKREVSPECAERKLKTE